MLRKKTVNFKRIEDKIIDKRLRVLKLLANDIKAGIIKRTQEGKSVSNKGFRKYSKSYRRYKSKYNGSSKPNLTDTEKMLNNITWKKVKNGIRMYFQNNEERAKAAGNQKLRKFFGLDKKQKDFIKKRLEKL